MIRTYCNYGIYDEDTAQCIEVGDSLDKISYFDDSKLIILEDVYVNDITKDEIELNLSDGSTTTIRIENIESFDN